MITRQTLLSFVDALGAATWIVVPFWLAAFAGIGTPLDPQYLGNTYHNDLVFTHVDYIGALLVTCSLAIILWALVYRGAAQASHSGALQTIVSLFALGFAANAARIYFFSWFDLGWVRDHLWLIGLAILGTSILAWKYRHLVLAVVPPMTRIGVTLFALSVVNTGVAIAKLEPPNIFSYEIAGSAPLATDTRAPTRVIWIIFDELDERVGFADRPRDVEMPSLDRFRGGSVVALDTMPPADVTLYSMPSLFLGRRILNASYPRQNDLELHPETGASISWRQTPGVFHDVRDAGYNAALLAQGGHAYCRLFAHLLSVCAENNAPWNAVERTALSAIAIVGQTILEHIPLMYRFLRRNRGTQHQNPNVDALFRFQDIVNPVLAEADIDLVFIHWNLPHWPFFYDHTTNAFIENARYGQSSVIGYLGNLELTDTVFGETRETLEAAELWQSSAVIVSADHRWRQAEKHDGTKSETVPMMVKLPGDDQIAKISTTVDSVRSRQLVLGLLKGEITTAEDVQRTLTP